MASFRLDDINPGGLHGYGWRSPERWPCQSWRMVTL